MTPTGASPLEQLLAAQLDQTVDGGEQKDPIVERYGKELKLLVDHHVDQDISTEKTKQYRMARRNVLFWQGRQHLVPDWVTSDFADFVEAGTAFRKRLDDEMEEDGEFDYPFNFVRSDGKKAQSVTGKAPGVKCVPDDPDDPDSQDAARLGDAMISHWRQAWNADQLQKKIQFFFWCTGPVFAHLRPVTNGKKHGITEIPEYAFRDVEITPAGYSCYGCGQRTPVPAPEMGPVNCFSCGRLLGPEFWAPAETVPVQEQVGVDQLENTDVEVTLYDCTKVTTAFDIQTGEDTPYLVLDVEAHWSNLLATYPELRAQYRKLKDSFGEAHGSAGYQSTGTTVRSQLASISGSRMHTRDRAHYRQVWLRPQMLELLEEDGAREELRTKFPEGMRQVYVNGELIKVIPEALDRRWKMRGVDDTTGLYEDPAVNDAIPLNELYNDTQALVSETIYRGVPATVVDSAVFDQETLSKRRPMGGELIFMPLKGQDPSKLMHNLPTAKFDSNVLPWAQQVREDSRDITGVTRALAGVEGGSMTAEEARLKHNAALRQLSTLYDQSRGLWKDIWTLALELCAEYGTGMVKAPPRKSVLGTTSRRVDRAAMKPTGWKIEIDEGMPGAFADERDRVQKFMTDAPMIADAIGLTHPANVESVTDYLRIPNIINPVEGVRRKTRWIIEQLLQGAPVMGPMGLEPSIPVDDFEDDHMLVVRLIQAWCAEEGMEVRQSNDAGYQNVVAYGRRKQQMAMMASMPPGGPGAPPPDGPPNGGPPPPGGGPLETVPGTMGSTTDFSAPPADQLPAGTPI